MNEIAVIPKVGGGTANLSFITITAFPSGTKAIEETSLGVPVYRKKLLNRLRSTIDDLSS